MHLNLVSWTAEDEERSDLPFIVKPLPSTKQELNTLFSEYCKEGQEKKSIVNVLLKRIRDYYSPEGQILEREERKQKWIAFNKFVVALLGLWLEEQDPNMASLLCSHLKELACENSVGSAIVQESEEAP